MLKGTPLGAVLDGIGTLYWVVLVGALMWTFVAAKDLRSGLKRAAVVVLFLVGPVAAIGLHLYREQSHAQATLNASAALFKARCKSAGERITRTVDNVEGVVWMKWRLGSANQTDQFKLDDPYGHDCSGDYCILRLLQITRDVERNPEDARRHQGKYEFVESLDPADGRRYRYTGAMKLRPMWTEDKVRAHEAATGRAIDARTYWPTLDREPIAQYKARFGITWEDLSTREDREHWIAGSSLKVIDLATNEVIAERIGYMMDVGQGNTNGGRSPWVHAEQSACPQFPTIGPSDTRRRRAGNESAEFVNRVLGNRKGE